MKINEADWCRLLELLTLFSCSTSITYLVHPSLTTVRTSLFRTNACVHHQWETIEWGTHNIFAVPIDQVYPLIVFVYWPIRFIASGTHFSQSVGNRSKLIEIKYVRGLVGKLGLLNSGPMPFFPEMFCPFKLFIVIAMFSQFGWVILISHFSPVDYGNPAYHACD